MTRLFQVFQYGVKITEVDIGHGFLLSSLQYFIQ